VVAGIGSYRDDTGFHGVCQASAILVIPLLLVVVYTVALMSVDRAVYLKKPLIYDDIITPWKTLVAIVILWIFCIAISLLPLFGFGIVGYSMRILTCIPIIQQDKEKPLVTNISYFILVVACGLLGLLVQLFGCGCIIYITRKSLMKRLRRALTGHRQRSNGRGTDEGNNGAQRKYQKDQLQMVKVFAVILSTSLLTIIPVGVLSVSSFFINMARARAWLITVAYLSVLSKSVLHSIVESYMTYEIRQTISKLLPSCTKVFHHMHATSGGEDLP
jgi:uncharacterized membrane protein YiaA